MELGFPNHPRADLESEIEWISDNGFDFVDLFLEPDKGVVEAIEPARVREALDRFDLSAVGHIAWYLPIGSPMPQLRRAAVDTAGEYLAVMAAIGLPSATVHANWPPGLFSETEGLRWQIESLRRIAGAAETLGIRVMYEPTDREQDRPEHLEAVLEAVPDLLCHLDLGHCNLCGRRPVEMIRRFGGRIHHIHLHDNDGRSDLHLPPGAGNINWRAVVRALKEVGYDGTITLEVFSRDRDYTLLAKQRIEELWRR
jgi:sugar phosphate isomerase/epimerase